MDENDLPPEGEPQGDAVEVNDAPVDAPDTQDAPVDAPPTVEDLASEMGWRPQDEWKGDPEKWKPAHEFMRHTVDVNRSLNTRLKGVEEQMGTMSRQSASIIERQVAKAREELLARREEAFETGDRDAWQKAEKELRELPTPEPTTPPETQSFLERNSSWFQKDPEATTWAINRTDELAKQGLGPARQLAIVEREAKGLFPEYFEAEKPKPKPAPLSQPGNRGAAPASKGFASLPSDAQKAGKDFVAKGWFTDLEDYARDYYKHQEA